MKGISPMIATVLLIAFTVAVGGIVSLWISGYTKTQTGQISSVSQDQIQCLNSILSIKSTSVNNDTATITVGYDSGTLVLNDVKADIVCGGFSNVTSGASSISPGDVFIVKPFSSNCDNVSNPINFERVRATCVGPSTGTNFTITTECKKGQGCGL